VWDVATRDVVWSSQGSAQGLDAHGLTLGTTPGGLSRDQLALLAAYGCDSAAGLLTA
jgi:hypothetical protein